MKIIIVGCGKFGTRLANYLNNQNHDVTVIDNRLEAFNNLGTNFTGRTLLGMGYDKDILEAAGIKMADALISCSSSDAINAVVSNIAHNIYHVNNVVARMYDKSKARIFRSMGIHIISITDLGVERILDYFDNNRLQVVKKIGENSEIKIIKLKAPLVLINKTVEEISSRGEFEIVAIERNDNTMMPLKDTKIKDNDIANGLVFEDTTTGDILFSIYPNSDLGYEQIGILNNVISFFKNQAGTHSFKIGTNKYLLFTDDGSLDVEDANILITASAFSLHLDSTAHIYGNVDIDGNIYADNISSDKRIKKNIKNSNIKALDLIKQIKHRQFEMKKDGTHYDIGYVAQELEKIDKNFVLIRKKDNKENERYYINELPILATATKAIQEQQDLIEKLQENDRKKDKLITDLANKIEQLEKEVQR